MFSLLDNSFPILRDEPLHDFGPIGSGHPSGLPRSMPPPRPHRNDSSSPSAESGPRRPSHRTLPSNIWRADSGNPSLSLPWSLYGRQPNDYAQEREQKNGDWDFHQMDGQIQAIAGQIVLAMPVPLPYARVDVDGLERSISVSSSPSNAIDQPTVVTQPRQHHHQHYHQPLATNRPLLT